MVLLITDYLSVVDRCLKALNHISYHGLGIIRKDISTNIAKIDLFRVTNKIETIGDGIKMERRHDSSYAKNSFTDAMFWTNHMLDFVWVLVNEQQKGINIKDAVKTAYTTCLNPFHSSYISKLVYVGIHVATVPSNVNHLLTSLPENERNQLRNIIDEVYKELEGWQPKS